MGKQVGRRTQYTSSSSVIVAIPQRVFKANPLRVSGSRWIAVVYPRSMWEAIVLLALGVAQDFRLYR